MEGSSVVLTGSVPLVKSEDDQMKRLKKYNAIAIAIVTAVIGGIPPAFAQEKAEFKVGNIVPYSGPAAVVGAVGRVQAAYFKRLNDNGGIRGRKINFISYDDARPIDPALQ